MTFCEKKDYVYRHIKDKSNRISKIWIQSNKSKFSNFINSNFSNTQLLKDSTINEPSQNYNIKSGIWMEWTPRQVGEWISSLGSNMNRYQDIVIVPLLNWACIVAWYLGLNCCNLDG